TAHPGGRRGPVRTTPPTLEAKGLDPGVRRDERGRGRSAASKQCRQQIIPSWVHPLDQIELPCAAPFFDLALATKGLVARSVVLIPDQAGDLVFRRETAAQLL